MPSAVFWTVGSKQHGMGHIQRCLVLSHALRERSVDSVFCTERETLGAERLRRAGVIVREFYEWDWSWAARRDFGSDAVILDVEGGPTRSMLEIAKSYFRRVIVIGGSGWTMRDREAIRELADLFICQTILPTDGDLTGAEYLIIDPEFAGIRGNPDGHIVIVFGGTDPHGLTPLAESVLKDIGRRLVIPNGSADSLVPHLNGAALLVGALGMTAFEAAAVGVPSVLVSWSDDHFATADELMRRHTALSIGVWDKFDGERLMRATESILKSKWGWYAMSAAGRALVDGRGAGRVADAIVGLLNGQS